MKMGSTHDIKKEDAEEQCFQKAYDEAIKRGGKTAELMTFFYGVPLESREKNDRPDLIRICRKGKRNPKDVIVGIEHFRVDQLSVKRGSCYESRGREIEKQLWNIYEAGHEELNRDGIVSISSATKVLNSIAELSKETIRRKYQDLLSSFDYVLAKHLKSVKEYRENVMKYSDGRPVEIAFLIEISSKFPQMFLNEKGRTSVKNDGLMPMLDNFVARLEAIDKKLVDYIILYMSNSTQKEKKSEVIAVKTGNVREHLRRQGITVYKYIGEDSYDTTPLHFTATKISPVDAEESGYNLTIGWDSKSEETIKEAVFAALGEAYRAKQKSIPFAATRIVQSALFATRGSIKRVYKEDGKTKIDFNGERIDQVRLNERYRKFEQIYGTIEAPIEE